MAKKNKVSPERNELAKKLVKEFDIRTVAEAQDWTTVNIVDRK